MQTPAAKDPSALLTGTVLASSSLTVMSNATISPSLPGLATAFSDTPGIEVLAGLVLSLPSLAIVLTAALFGWAADRFDRRRLLPAVMLIYAAGGASALLASSMTEILAGRIVLGIGVAGVMTSVTKAVADLWSGPARAKVMGWQSAAMSGGGVVFLLAGGALAELGWRGPFAVYLAALPLALLVWRVLPATPPRPAVPPPDLPLPRRHMLGLGAIAFFGMATFYLVPTRLPFLLADVGVEAPSAAGLAIAAMTATSVPGALLFGRIRMRLGHAAIFALSFGLMGAGYVVIALAEGLGVAIAGTMIAGMGLGPLMPNQATLLMSRVPEAARGRAAGLLTTAVFTGQFASPLLAGLAATRLSGHAVFLAFAAALVTASAAALLLAARSEGRPATS